MGLISIGHDVHVLTSRRGASNCSPNPEIHRLLYNEIDYQSRFTYISSLWNYPHKRSINEVILNTILTHYKPQVVVVWGMWNLSRRLLHQLENYPESKLLYYVADYWPSLPNAVQLHWEAYPDNPFKKFLIKNVGKIVLMYFPQAREKVPLEFKHVLCVSHALRDRLVDQGRLPETAGVLFNGIDLDIFAYTPKSTTSKTGVNFLYSGRLSKEKGVHTILESLGLLKKENITPSLGIIGAGDTNYEKMLKHLTRNLGIQEQVDFAGYTNREKIPGILAQYDVHIIPSIWEEPLPRTIQEAMALGKAVIASDVGGIPEIVLDELNGLLFQPGDAFSLAQKMQKLIHNPELIGNFGSAGRLYVEEQFNIKHMVNNIEKFVLELV